MQSLQKKLLQTTRQTNMSDSINNPKHYNSGQFEVIDVIEDWELGFNLGNTVKYIGRAGKKDPDKHIEDLKKARWYLDREINRLDKSWETGAPVAELSFKDLTRMNGNEVSPVNKKELNTLSEANNADRFMENEKEFREFVEQHVYKPSGAV